MSNNYFFIYLWGFYWVYIIFFLKKKMYIFQPILMNRINNDRKYFYLICFIHRHRLMKLEALQMAVCRSVVDSLIDSEHEKCRELFVSVNNYILSHAH